MSGAFALVLRIVLYVLAGWLANAGIAEFNPETGVLMLNVDAIVKLAGGGTALGLALAWRHLAKAVGGVT